MGQGVFSRFLGGDGASPADLLVPDISEDSSSSSSSEYEHNVIAVLPIEKRPTIIVVGADKEVLSEIEAPPTPSLLDSCHRIERLCGLPDAQDDEDGDDGDDDPESSRSMPPSSSLTGKRERDDPVIEEGDPSTPVVAQVTVADDDDPLFHVSK